MTRRRTPIDQPKLDRSWHLARTPPEMDVAEIEYALIRCFEAFGHWQADAWRRSSILARAARRTRCCT